MGSLPPPMNPQMPPPYPPRKKSSPVVWILAILGTLFLLGILVVGGGIWYLKHKLNQAGISAELMRRNPALAGARIAAALNPNIEIISVDEDRQTLSFRDKKTGKVSTISFENAKNGRWSMSEDGKRVDVTSTGQGPNGTIEMKSPEGTLKMGGAATDLPSWVPRYPGSNPENAVSSNQASESGGMFHFKTKDSVQAVMKYYADQMPTAGLKVKNTTTSTSEGKEAGVLIAEDDVGQRHFSAQIAEEDGQNGVTVVYSTKK